MNRKTVEIAGIKIGEDYPIRIAAEIGTYFGADIELAKEYLNAAKKAGVEFLKTEILHDLSVIWDNSMTHTYNTDLGPKTENYRSLLARKVVPLNEYRKLFEYSLSQGLPVIASVYDMKGVDFMVSAGGAALKIASQNITNKPLIEYCAKSGLPVIMDTGNALLEEVASAVKWAEESYAAGVILNHRPDGSPCPAHEHNMRIIKAYKQAFGWPVGLSCHYDGDEMVYLAIGMGAVLIEKPLYHKRERDDQDTMFTLHYEKFSEMVKKIRNCSAAIGSGIRSRQIPAQLDCRACIVASKDIPAGTALSLDNIVFAWPMRGIPAARWKEAEGLVAGHDLKKSIPVNWGDIKKDEKLK